uniref:Uncharacterized protein n=1 Tax=Strix occidentalis caurina TaxID=311401 RepID=A0A8D0ERY4_STROC
QAAPSSPFLASKEQFHAYLRARGEPGGQVGGEEEEVEEKKDDVGSCQSEPPAKRVRSEDLGQDGESREDAGAEEKEPTERKRARGQNKSRPCMKPNHYEQSRLTWLRSRLTWGAAACSLKPSARTTSPKTSSTSCARGSLASGRLMSISVVWPSPMVIAGREAKPQGTLQRSERCPTAQPPRRAWETAPGVLCYRSREKIPNQTPCRVLASQVARRLPPPKQWVR